MEIPPYLPYLLPPLLGALIGYVTNYIAIRMLFRPLKPWRVFGLRLPLTPGIIPAKRGELARKMGEMVGDHLLTAEDVGRAFEKPTIQNELRLAVTDKLGRLLDRELGPLASLVPRRFEGRFRELVDLARNKLVSVVFRYLESEDFERRLRDFLLQKSDYWLARDLNGLVSAEQYQHARCHLDQLLSQFLSSEALADSVAHYVDHKTESLFASEKTLRELLPPELIELLLDQLERELPPLVERFGGMLYDPDFRKRLIEKGKRSIDAFLDSLGGLAGLLSGFMDLNKIYDKIPGFLDKAGDEIATWLKEEETQRKLVQLLRERVDSLLDRSPASYLEKLSYDKVRGVRHFVREQTLIALRSRRTAETALALAEAGYERIKDRSFDNLLRSGLPDGTVDRGKEFLVTQLLELLRSSQARQAFATVLREQGDYWLFQKELGLLSARLPNDLRRELEAAICQLVEELLKREAPRLVETLNVQRMVEEKVNGLDLLQVEGLLMGIMKEQFKYINLFGGLLGFLIGLLNLLLLGLHPA